MFHSNVSQPGTNRFSLMCVNLNHMLHSNLIQLKTNVHSLMCCPPYTTPKNKIFLNFWQILFSLFQRIQRSYFFMETHNHKSYENVLRTWIAIFSLIKSMMGIIRINVFAFSCARSWSFSFSIITTYGPKTPFFEFWSS